MSFWTLCPATRDFGISRYTTLAETLSLEFQILNPKPQEHQAVVGKTIRKVPKEAYPGIKKY